MILDRSEFKFIAITSFKLDAGKLCSFICTIIRLNYILSSKLKVSLH